MHLSSSAIKATLIALVLLMPSFALMALPVEAQQYTNRREGGGAPLPAGVTPDVSYDTIAHMNFRPNPVGVSQPLLVNLWLQPPIHVSRYFKQAFLVTFTKPDGTEVKIGPMDTFAGDTTSWFEYVVDQIGTWKIKFDFHGGYFPPGNYTVQEGYFSGGQVLNAPLGVYYKPSSDGPYSFVVQNDVVLSWPGSPLPTDYWTRPVSPENREWWPILGNYPGTGVVAGVGRGVSINDWPDDTNKYMSNYGFIPYVQGPKSAHIVWKRQGAIGGLIGGTLGMASFTSGGGGPSIVYAGRAYESLTKESDGVTQNVWQCYDIRTGEVFWEKTGITQVPTMILYSEKEMTVVPGETASTLGMRVDFIYVGGGRLITYSPWNGAVTMNISISPLTSGTYYASWDWPYFLSVQTLGSGASAQYRLINWTIEGDVGSGFTLTNFRLGVENNITWPWSSLGVVDYEVGIAINTFGITTSSTGVTYGQRIEAASLTTGASLWNATTDVTKGTEGFFSGSTRVADHGKFAVRLNDGHWHCWDLNSGKKLWVSELSSWPWGTFGCYGVQSYGGMIISNQYDAVVAYNWTNGKISWRYKYVAPYPYESLYADSETGEGYYPWFHEAGRIADGVLYTTNTEHSISEPIPRGHKFHAINITTGEGIWNITGTMFITDFRSAVADGYLAFSNAYDGYMYVIGKGKSVTTVTGSPKVSVHGTNVLIEGTVLDQSPAQLDTPCVSKGSMATQMEYLHMQLPIDGVGHDIQMTGVPVVLTAMDSSGSVINIGTATTSAYYGTFEMAWTPPAEGTYRIIASFAGDESYGSSAASTAVAVGPAPAEITIPEQIVPPDYTMAILGSAIAVIVAVAVIGVALFFVLRKR